jgi:hypothetical protein
MGHYSHAVELRQDIAQQAVKRIVGTGATLRMQGPLIRHINEDPSWAELWQTGVRLGAIPYYMFVERDTGRAAISSCRWRRRTRFSRPPTRWCPACRARCGAVHERFPGKVVIDDASPSAAKSVCPAVPAGA